MNRMMLIGVMILSMTSSSQAAQKELTAQWDTYTDTTATGLKLFWNEKPSPQWMKTIDGNIPPDSTRWQFQIDASPGDTLWFAMQAVNRDAEPALFSELTPWVPWVFLLPAPKPPVPPEGLKITVTFELINP